MGGWDLLRGKEETSREAETSRKNGFPSKHLREDFQRHKWRIQLHLSPGSTELHSPFHLTPGQSPLPNEGMSFIFCWRTAAVQQGQEDKESQSSSHLSQSILRLQSIPCLYLNELPSDTMSGSEAWAEACS